MNIIKLYYKGEFNEEIDNIVKDAMGKKSYLLVGSGYNFKKEERDLEFEFTPIKVPMEKDGGLGCPKCGHYCICKQYE